MARIAVTGLGCISALGASVAEAWAAALAGRSSIRPWTTATTRDGPQTSLVAAAIGEDFMPLLFDRFDRKQLQLVDRFANLAVVATAEAIADAGLRPGDEVLRSAAIVYGASCGGPNAIESAYQRMFLLGAANPHPLTIPRLMNSSVTSHLSILFGVKGPSLTIATACASSSHAVAEGMHMIRAGRAKVVVVGGADASLTYGSVQAWKGLQAMSETACRPFSMGRDGTALGEGAATLVLEDEQHAISRGAKIYAIVAGAGATSDASHMTQPDATQAAASVRLAHRDAQLAFDEPVLISAHGTGTLINDATEAAVLREIYAPCIERCRVIATKSVHGHMLGATGAMELLLGIKALVEGMAPPISNYLGADPECDLPLVLQAERVSFRALVSPSFAFGGLNSTLVATLP